MTKKQMNILIPNASSPKNTGDLAMLQVLLSILRKNYKSALIKVHSAEPKLHKNNDLKVDYTLYNWSVFRDRRAFSRIINVTKLVCQYLVIKSGIKNFSVDNELGSLISDYKNADLIIFVGGGYLRSKKGVTQSLNLLMHLSLFCFAGLFPVKKIVAPISIGPFGYRWQEKFVVYVLKQMDLVALREEISYRTLLKYKMKNIILSSDHALMVKKIDKKDKKKKLTLGFTIRKWLSGEESTNFEKSFVDTITRFSKLKGAKIQPIVQVDASKYGEDDVAVTKKIAEKIKDNNISVLNVKKVTSVKNALKAYSNIDILLGMRMHSNILAAIQGTPFVAISYEHKTQGIAKGLGMEKYCIRCEDVDNNNLYQLLEDVYKKRDQLREKLNYSIKENLQDEIQKWNYYLAQ